MRGAVSVTKAIDFPDGQRTAAFTRSVKKITDSVRSQQQRKPDNPEEYRRFVDMARELETDERPDAMDRAFERVVKPKGVTPDPRKKR